MGSTDDATSSHPSYGFIRLGHPSGGDGRLFMSPLRHDHRISIVIGEAEHVRQHNTDTHFARPELVEVDLSQEQFARFVCGLDSRGAPCTIRRVSGASVPPPPSQLSAERHYDEARETTEEVSALLRKLAEDVEAIAAKAPARVREQLRSRIGEAYRAVGDKLPWIVQTLHEHMDKVVNSAKVEIEAHIHALGARGVALDHHEAPATQPILAPPSECCQGGEKSYGRCHGCQRR